jgi:hypothetical protein
VKLVAKVRPLSNCNSECLNKTKYVCETCDKGHSTSMPVRVWNLWKRWGYFQLVTKSASTTQQSSPTYVKLVAKVSYCNMSMCVKHVGKVGYFQIVTKSASTTQQSSPACVKLVAKVRILSNCNKECLNKTEYWYQYVMWNMQQRWGYFQLVTRSPQ